MRRSAGSWIGNTLVTFALCCSACTSSDDGDDAGGDDGSGQGLSSAECQSCTESKCSSQLDACDAADGCGEVVDCILSCDTTDSSCQLDCAEQGSELSMEALMAGTQLQACLVTSCVQDCWNVSTSSTAAPGSTTAGGAGSGFASTECQGCADDSCSTQRSACDQEDGCGEVVDCITGCSTTDSDCILGCADAAAALSAAAQQAGNAYGTCLAGSCTSQCFSVDVSTTAGASSTPPSPTVPPLPTSSGLSQPGMPSSTAPTTGELISGVNWLTFEGDWADASVAPNSDLGISGSMYAFGDDCATLTWDPATRCISGELCEPGADFANWGVAVGFDFYNTGEEGTPPNAKKTWSATAAAARGVAWQLSGTAPELQVWLTNMAPSHSGTCTADSCEISGPPDGTPSASLSGELYFTSLTKDDWGGSGTVYTFDPSAILALQFKLAAVNTGAASYSFCVDAVGIIR